MPASRAARMTATRVSAGSRSNVRHEPRDSTETSIPVKPSGRDFSEPDGIVPPLGALPPHAGSTHTTPGRGAQGESPGRARRVAGRATRGSAAGVIADPDRLDVAELPDALDEQFPAVTGALDAAERKLRVRGHVAVDEDHPGVQVPDQPVP